MLYITTFCSFLVFIGGLTVAVTEEESSLMTLVSFIVCAAPFGYLMCEVIDRLF